MSVRAPRPRHTLPAQTVVVTMATEADLDQVPLLPAATATNPITPGQITGPQLYPAITRPMLGLTKRGWSEFFAPTVIHLLVAVLRVAAFVSFVYLVLANLDLPYAYLRPEQKPGPLTDDRLSFGFFLLAVGGVHVVGLGAQLLMLAGVRDSWRRTAHFYLDSVVLLLTLVQFAALLGILWFGCNRSYSGGSLCNDDRWCAVYAPGGSSRCPVYGGPPVSAGDLRPAFGFVAFCWLSGITLALTGAALAFNSLLRDANRTFRHRTGDQMDVTL